jgi:dipeptidyl aminopeptidase/acylaminoacyl peptidase
VHDETFPCWSPDGNQIAFISNRSDDPDLNPDAHDVFVMPAGGGAPQRLETKIGSKFGLAFSPDGRWLTYVGSEGEGNWWRNNGLWVVPADGSAPARNLTEEHYLHVANSTLGDIADRPFTAPVWSADSKRIYFQVSRHGNTSLYSITLDGAIEELIAAGGVISNFTFDAGRRRLAYLWSHFRDPGQVWTRTVDEESARQLTRVNEAWLGALDLGTLEEVWYPGPDGNKLQGWILKPPGFDPTQRYPSILEIHGGPWLQYGNLFMHEFYYLAAHGYVVTFTNPRGGQGYGEAHGKAIHLDWGGPDYADVMAWADRVAQEPYIDRERMGVTGGSYGGFMTLWIIGHTDRFRAAVAQRPVSNAISFWGSSDVGYLFEDPWADNKPLWEDIAAYWDQSPMKYIGNATTPTLLIHSEQDLRCNPEQSYQAFQALKMLGVDTELILFPGESHGLSRGGRTDRRIARLEHILRWFETYLQP